MSNTTTRKCNECGQKFETISDFALTCQDCQMGYMVSCRVQYIEEDLALARIEVAREIKESCMIAVAGLDMKDRHENGMMRGFLDVVIKCNKIIKENEESNHEEA